MNEEKVIIGNKQLRALVVCLSWPTIINYGSGLIARQVGHDLWISGIFSVLTTMLFIFIVVAIGRNCPGKTIAEYSQDLFGKIPGKLLGLILSFYFMVCATNTISMYIQHLTDFLLPETPFLVVTIMHISVICYLTWHGPEVIGRIGTIAFLLTCIFYFLVFLSSVPEFDLSRFRTVFDSGILTVAKASLTADSFTGIIQLVIAMLLPLAAKPDKAFRSAAAGLAIGGAFFVFYFIAELMVMGEQLIALMRIASMDFVRSIQITKYMHRFESFMVALWYWSMLVQTGILAYCSLKAFMQTVGMKKKNPYLVLIFGLLLGGSTYYIGSNRVIFLRFWGTTWQYISLSFQYLLPAALLAAMLIKKALSDK